MSGSGGCLGKGRWASEVGFSVGWLTSVWVDVAKLYKRDRGAKTRKAKHDVAFFELKWGKVKMTLQRGAK